MLPIYTITTIPSDFPFKDSRCVGWFESCHAAAQEVKNNSGDIYEDGHYRYVVIEQVEEGLYTLPGEEIWFEWNEGRILVATPSPGYIILKKKPNRFNNIACFSIG